MIGTERKLVKEGGPRKPPRPSDYLRDAIDNASLDAYQLGAHKLGGFQLPTTSTSQAPVTSPQTTQTPGDMAGLAPPEFDKKASRYNRIAGGIGLATGVASLLAGSDYGLAAASGITGAAAENQQNLFRAYDASKETFDEGVKRLEEITARNNFALELQGLKEQQQIEKEQRQAVLDQKAAEYENKLRADREGNQAILEDQLKAANPVEQAKAQAALNNSNAQVMDAQRRAYEAQVAKVDKANGEVQKRRDKIQSLQDRYRTAEILGDDEGMAKINAEIQMNEERLTTELLKQQVSAVMPKTDIEKLTMTDLGRIANLYRTNPKAMPEGLVVTLAVRASQQGLLYPEELNAWLDELGIK